MRWTGPRPASAMLVLWLLGVGTPHGGLAAGLPGAAGAVTPVLAVLAVVRPYYVPGYSLANCSRSSPRLHPGIECPETARLRHWLRVRRLPMQESSLPFCRCQSGPRTTRIRQVANTGRVARVNVWWDRGVASFTDTFVVVRGPAGWAVDDEYCLGRPATSVYTKAGSAPCR